MTGCTSGTSVPARVSSSRRRITGYRPNVRAARRLEDLGRARPRPATQILTTAAVTYAASHARKPRPDANPGLFRVALKMATGTGKTVRHGDAYRLAGAQQGRQQAGRPLLRRVPTRVAGHHDPGSAARPSAREPGQLLPTARSDPEIQAFTRIHGAGSASTWRASMQHSSPKPSSTGSAPVNMSTPHSPAINSDATPTRCTPSQHGDSRRRPTSDQPNS